MRTELARWPAGAVGVKCGSSQLEAMGSERWLRTPLPRRPAVGSPAEAGTWQSSLLSVLVN